MMPLQAKVLKFQLYLLALLCLAVLLTGCSKSAHSKIPVTANAAALTGLGAEDPGSKLLAKSVEELVDGGRAYMAMGNPDLARLHYTIALQKEPTSSAAYLGLAKLSENTGNYEQATHFYRKAVELDSASVEGLVGIIRTLRYDNHMDEAEIAVQRALKTSPGDLRVLSERAILHDLMGRPELAEPIYRQILENNPQQATILNNLGISQMLRRDYQAASHYFRQALELDRNNPRIKNNLAMVYALNGDEQNALRLFTDTLGEAAAYNNLGYLYLTNGRLDDAEHALRKALELNPQFYQKAQQNLDRVEQLRHSGN